MAELGACYLTAAVLFAKPAGEPNQERPIGIGGQPLYNRAGMVGKKLPLQRNVVDPTGGRPAWRRLVLGPWHQFWSLRAVGGGGVQPVAVFSATRPACATGPIGPSPRLPQ